MVLAGRTALVTGAATGIGRATAIAFAAEGARVAVNHHGQHAEAQAVVDLIRGHGGEAMAFEADVTSADALAAMVDAIVQQLGPIDIAIHQIHGGSCSLLFTIGMVYQQSRNFADGHLQPCRGRFAE